MSGGQNESPRGWQADTGQDNRYATAAGNPRLSPNGLNRKSRRAIARAKRRGAEYSDLLAQQISKQVGVFAGRYEAIGQTRKASKPALVVTMQKGGNDD